MCVCVCGGGGGGGLRRQSNLKQMMSERFEQTLENLFHKRAIKCSEIKHIKYSAPSFVFLLEVRALEIFHY